VIAERIGWTRSIRVLSARVAELRPVYAAGEIASAIFWFPDVAVPVGGGRVRTATQLPVLTMVWGSAAGQAINPANPRRAKRAAARPCGAPPVQHHPEPGRLPARRSALPIRAPRRG
jgi:hypothetical protein